MRALEANRCAALCVGVRMHARCVCVLHAACQLQLWPGSFTSCVQVVGCCGNNRCGSAQCVGGSIWRPRVRVWQAHVMGVMISLLCGCEWCGRVIIRRAVNAVQRRRLRAIASDVRARERSTRRRLACVCREGGCAQACLWLPQCVCSRCASVCAWRCGFVVVARACCSTVCTGKCVGFRRSVGSVGRVRGYVLVVVCRARVVGFLHVCTTSNNTMHATR